MGYLLSDQEIIKAAIALSEANEESVPTEGVPSYLYVLLNVGDDTRAKLVANPNWLMEDHSNDSHWEEAQEAFSEWENEVYAYFIHPSYKTEDWTVWINGIRKFRDASRADAR